MANLHAALQAHVAAAGERHRRTPGDHRPAVLDERTSTASALDQSLSAWYDRRNTAAQNDEMAAHEAVQRLDALRQSMLDAADIALVSDFMCAA